VHNVGVNLTTITDLTAAAARVRDFVVRTPLLPSLWAPAARPLWLKPELLQPIGAFKIDATRAHGAEVVVVPPADRESAAAQVVAERGGTLVPPFDHPDVIAGQGTLGLEIADDLPDVELVLVPVSGGGLISGVAAAIKARAPRAKVIGVEPELAGDTADSFRAGRLVDWSTDDRARTIADGLRSTPSELTFAHIQKFVDDVVTVSEDEIRDAMAVLATRSHLVAEPSGAVATAAYLHADVPAGRTVAVVSGGNVDPALLLDVLSAQRASA